MFNMINDRFSTAKRAAENTVNAVKRKKAEISSNFEMPKATTDAPKTSGLTIKNNIKNVLSKKYSIPDTRHLFDGIDDKAVEDKLPMAENTIKTNVGKGLLSKDYRTKLPNLRDGLALSYAAADRGKQVGSK